jgi:hypothetical protein
MRKYLFLFLCLIFLPTMARATSVTATVVDAASQAWFNGTWSATLVTKPGFYPPSTGYVIGSTQMPVPNAHGVSGTMNGSGAFSVTLTDVTTIAPAGATWRIQVCPLASSGCFVAQVDVTGVSEDISAQLAPPAATVNLSLPAAYYLAYSDSEIINGNLGQTYMNLTSSQFRVCASFPCGWVGLVATSGSATANEIAVWASPTAIGGDPSFVQDPMAKFVTITIPQVTDDDPALALIDASAPMGSAMQFFVGDAGSSSVDATTPGGDSEVTFDAAGNIVFYTPAQGSPIMEIDAADPNVTFFPGSLLKFKGATGSAALGVASAAGTPCTLLLPTASPSAGQFLQSAAPSGSTCQGSWATPAGTGVTSVTGTPPIASSGGTTPAISCSTCVTSVTASAPIVSTGGTTPVISCPSCSTGASSVTAVDAVTQSAAINTTAILVCPASPAGGTNYLLSWNAKATTAPSAGGPTSTLGPLRLTTTTPDGTAFSTISLQYTIWKSAPGLSIDTAGDTTNSTTQIDMGLPILINCEASSTISYAMGYASTGTPAMVYDLHIRLQQQ